MAETPKTDSQPVAGPTAKPGEPTAKQSAPQEQPKPPVLTSNQVFLEVKRWLAEQNMNVDWVTDTDLSISAAVDTFSKGFGGPVVSLFAKLVPTASNYDLSCRVLPDEVSPTAVEVTLKIGPRIIRQTRVAKDWWSEIPFPSSSESEWARLCRAAAACVVCFLAEQQGWPPETHGVRDPKTLFFLSEVARTNDVTLRTQLVQAATKVEPTTLGVRFAGAVNSLRSIRFTKNDSNGANDPQLLMLKSVFESIARDALTAGDGSMNLRARYNMAVCCLHSSSSVPPAINNVPQIHQTGHRLLIELHRELTHQGRPSGAAVGGRPSCGCTELDHGQVLNLQYGFLRRPRSAPGKEQKRSREHGWQGAEAVIDAALAFSCFQTGCPHRDLFKDRAIVGANSPRAFYNIACFLMESQKLVGGSGEQVDSNWKHETTLRATQYLRLACELDPLLVVTKQSDPSLVELRDPVVTAPSTARFDGTSPGDGRREPGTIRPAVSRRKLRATFK